MLWSSASRVHDSLYSKAARLLDGSEQLVVQFVVVLVGRNVDPIETGEEKKRKEKRETYLNSAPLTQM